MDIESLNLEEQLRQFDGSHKSDPMFQWARIVHAAGDDAVAVPEGYREGNWSIFASTSLHMPR